MKKTIMTATILTLTMHTQMHAQSKSEQSVKEASLKLKDAMIKGDSTALNQIIWPQLSYGHSGGHVEGNKEFVEKLSSGASDFVSINISSQQIFVIDDTAIERHHLQAETNDGGKAGEVSLDIMLVWKKDKKQWKLLARQAVKSKH